MFDREQSTRLLQCLSMWYDAKNFNSLQRVQNSLARVVRNAPYRSSSQPLLKSLHWLPVIVRVEYKLAAMPYKALLTPGTILPSPTHRSTQTSSDSAIIKFYSTQCSTHQNNYSNPCFPHLCHNCLEQPAIWSQRGIFTTSIPVPTQGTSFSTRLLLTIATRRQPLYHRLKWHWMTASCTNSVIGWLIEPCFLIDLLSCRILFVYI